MRKTRRKRFSCRWFNAKELWLSEL
jgi:hypothetical protein